MNKKIFENELIVGMQQELHKRASADAPNLIKAAECLHAAMEIFEETGFQSRADEILEVLSKIASMNSAINTSIKLPSIDRMMAAGVTQHDFLEFNKGNLIAKAKINIALRSLGNSNFEIAQLIGSHNVIPEAQARDLINPNRSAGNMWQELVSNAKKPTHDNLTSEKMVKNLKDHGTVFNMADDNLADIAQPTAFNKEYDEWADKKTHKPSKMTKEDLDFFGEPVGDSDAELFDLNMSDDELLNLEIKEDSLEVFDKEIPLDFEDERSSIK